MKVLTTVHENTCIQPSFLTIGSQIRLIQYIARLKKKKPYAAAAAFPLFPVFSAIVWNNIAR